jgi:hypothetical protein
MSDNIFICKICNDAFYLEAKHKKYTRCVPCHREQENKKEQVRRQNRSEEQKEKKRECVRKYQKNHRNEINEKTREKRQVECGMSGDEINYVNEKFDTLVSLMGPSMFESKYDHTPKKKRWFLREHCQRMTSHTSSLLNYNDTLYNKLPASSDPVSEVV